MLSTMVAGRLLCKFILPSRIHVHLWPFDLRLVLGTVSRKKMEAIVLGTVPGSQSRTAVVFGVIRFSILDLSKLAEEFEIDY